MEGLRVVIMGKDFDLRLVSLVVRARESADQVLIVDLGSTDDTIELAKKVDCEVISHEGDLSAPSLARVLLEMGEFESTLLVDVNKSFRLRDLPLLVNRARENWDVHMAFQVDKEEGVNPQEVIYESATVTHLAASRFGLEALSEASPNSSPIDLPSELKVRVIPSKVPPVIQQRESLATASKFAQLFYWMIESKHPLLLFGIPGTILFIIGFKLSGNALGNFNEWNQSTVGFGLAVIAVTLIGLFSMMVGIILYIMGKQVGNIQAQYDDWPKTE